MAMYQAGTAAAPETFTNRIAVVFESSGSSTVDVTLSLTDAAVEFWDAIVAAGDTNGHRIMFTASDGITELVWERATWSYANRTVDFNIDAVSLATTTEAAHVIYLYVGNDGTGDLAGSPTIASAITGYIVGQIPRDVLTVPAAPPGSSAPTVRIQKTSDESRLVWLDIRPFLATAAEEYHGSRLWEEIAYCIQNVLAADVDQTALYDTTKIRVYRGLVRVLLQAGSSGTTYTLSLRVATATPYEPSTAAAAPTRILDLRALLVVEDIDES